VPGSDGWLLVCKPLRPPFRDGTTVLVRTLVEGLPRRIRLAYFGDTSAPLRAGGIDDVIEAAAMPYAPSMASKARVLAALLSRRHAGRPLHFFFTPNRVTSRVLAGLRRLQPKRAMVQSIMSSDDVERFAGWLGPLDAIVVGSDHTRQRLRQAGIDDDRLHRIYPGVEAPAEAVVDPAAARRLLYAGDLDEGAATRLIAITSVLRGPARAGWRLTVACRPKSDQDAAARTRLRTELAGDITAGRVEVLAEVDDFDALLRDTSLLLFVADHVRRKVDLPLVLLEGMARGIGVVSLGFSPLDEIFAAADRHGLRIGSIVRPGDEAGLVAAVAGPMDAPGTLLRFGRDARQLVLREFESDTMIRQYTALYEALDESRIPGVRE
jgi:glycosyltransferase involved in cell wall biosynthesis